MFTMDLDGQSPVAASTLRHRALTAGRRGMMNHPDVQRAAALTALSLDLAELAAEVDGLRAQLRRMHAELTCARLDAVERLLPEPL